MWRPLLQRFKFPRIKICCELTLVGLPQQQKHLTLTHFHLVAGRSGGLCCLGSAELKQFLAVYSQFQDHFVNR